MYVRRKENPSARLTNNEHIAGTFSKVPGEEV
jgi:hypothetical protein